MFRMQDWAWGNTMMALRDALAVAIVLDRRPVMLLTPELPPLNTANLSSVLDAFGITVVHEPLHIRHRFVPPAGTHVISTVGELQQALRRRVAPSRVIYSRVLFTFDIHQSKRMIQLARAFKERAWARLFLDDAPDCWAAAFVRPSPRVSPRSQRALGTPDRNADERGRLLRSCAGARRCVASGARHSLVSALEALQCHRMGRHVCARAGPA